MFFTVSYILLLGVALYHGLYGLRTILFELTLSRVTEKVISAILLVLGLGLFGLGTWAAITVHAIANIAVRG
jgi:succinate dehydrogenase / fumarate reductase membrane anchor subunit